MTEFGDRITAASTAEGKAVDLGRGVRLFDLLKK